MVLKEKYTCEFVGFSFNNWSDEIDLKYGSEYSNIDFTYISATRKPFLHWFFSTVSQIVCKSIYFIFEYNLLVNAYASDKRSFLLNLYLLNKKPTFDLIVAHNFGALYPAWRISKKRNIPFAFDVEDYHPGELIAKNNRVEKNRRTILMQKLLPEAACVSFAGRPIFEKMESILSKNSIRNPLVINNCFPKGDFVEPKVTEGKIKMVWFSQYITDKRGLEEFIPVLEGFKRNLSITLVGSLREDFYRRFLSNFSVSEIKASLPQIELHSYLSGFDIGLASEIGSIDENKQLAVSNKIYAYAQAGLFILATDTTGQSLFIKSNPGLGILTKSNKDEIYQSIKHIIQNIDEIRRTKSDRFENGKKLAWENESTKLLKAIDKILERN